MQSAPANKQYFYHYHILSFLCSKIMLSKRCKQGVKQAFHTQETAYLSHSWRYSQILPWQTNKILIFLIFPVFSGFSSLFTFLHFSLILAYFGISLHIFVINFGKNFGKFQVCTKGKSAIGNRQVRNWGLR